MGGHRGAPMGGGQWLSLPPLISRCPPPQLLEKGWGVRKGLGALELGMGGDGGHPWVGVGRGAAARPPPPLTSWRPPQLLETQAALRAKEVEALRAQWEALGRAGGGERPQEGLQEGLQAEVQAEVQAELQAELQALQAQFEALQQPLQERRRRLLASKEEQQFLRDLQDEMVSGGLQGGRGAAVGLQGPGEGKAAPWGASGTLTTRPDPSVTFKDPSVRPNPLIDLQGPFSATQSIN